MNRAPATELSLKPSSQSPMDRSSHIWYFREEREERGGVLWHKDSAQTDAAGLCVAHSLTAAKRK